MDYRNMEDKKSPTKIKRETQVYWHQKNSLVKWSDIKNLELEDDDVIRSEWVDDDQGGYYIGEITRMVEETDEQFNERIANNERDAKWAKDRRWESYLRLKKEFENE
jgi:hypothetical protein